MVLLNRMLGFLMGILSMDLLFHTRYVFAIELGATTTGERMGSLLFGAVMTLFFYYLCKKFFPVSFFHGVLAASGFFASFDIMVFHWIFKLHRLTYGPEVNVIEPFLVVVGIAMLVYAIYKERNIS